MLIWLVGIAWGCRSGRRRVVVARVGCAAIASALLGALAGCGGQGGAASTAARSAAAGGAAVPRADAICARRNRELASLRGASSGADPIVFARRAAIERRTLGELDELTPPARQAGAWREMLAQARASVHDSEALAHAARAHDLSAVRSLSSAAGKGQLGSLFSTAHSGLAACAVSAAPPTAGGTRSSAIAEMEALQRLYRSSTAAKSAPAP